MQQRRDDSDMTSYSMEVRATIMIAVTSIARSLAASLAVMSGDISNIGHPRLHYSLLVHWVCVRMDMIVCSGGVCSEILLSPWRRYYYVIIVIASHCYGITQSSGGADGHVDEYGCWLLRYASTRTIVYWATRLATWIQASVEYVLLMLRKIEVIYDIVWCYISRCFSNILMIYDITCCCISQCFSIFWCLPPQMGVCDYTIIKFDG